MASAVSLLSRVRVAYIATGRPSQAITEVLVQTARVIAAAAPTMLGGLALNDDVLLKLIGVGLAGRAPHRRRGRADAARPRGHPSAR